MQGGCADYAGAGHGARVNQIQVSMLDKNSLTHANALTRARKHSHAQASTLCVCVCQIAKDEEKEALQNRESHERATVYKRQIVCAVWGRVPGVIERARAHTGGIQE